MCESIIDTIFSGLRSLQEKYGVNIEEEGSQLHGNTGRSTFEISFKEDKITLTGNPQDTFFKRILEVLSQNIDSLPVVSHDHNVVGYDFYTWDLVV